MTSGFAYFEINKAQGVQFTNITLDNFTYTDIYAKDSYIIRLDSNDLNN